MSGYPEIAEFSLALSMPGADFSLRLETLFSSALNVGQKDFYQVKQADNFDATLNVAQKFTDDIGG